MRETIDLLKEKWLQKNEKFSRSTEVGGHAPDAGLTVELVKNYSYLIILFEEAYTNVCRCF